jgi:hypothetical protein
VDGERVGLPASPVERGHQLCSISFPQRIGSHQRGQLTDQASGVPTQGQLGRDPVLDRGQPQLAQPQRLDAQLVHVLQTVERRPAVEAGRLPQQPGGSFIVAAGPGSPGRLHQPLEPE